MYTEEGNRLIARFRGDSCVHEYHEDWNALMEVIQKIEDIDENNPESNNNFHFFIGKRYTRVVYDWNTYSSEWKEGDSLEKYTNASKDYRHTLFDNKRMSTWFAVVEFIKYWEEINKK